MTVMAAVLKPVFPVSVSVAVTLYTVDPSGQRVQGPGPENMVPSLA